MYFRKLKSLKSLNVLQYNVEITHDIENIRNGNAKLAINGILNFILMLRISIEIELIPISITSK